MKHALIVLVWVLMLYSLLPQAEASTTNAIVTGEEAQEVLLMTEVRLPFSSPRQALECMGVTAKRDMNKPRTMIFTTETNQYPDGTRIRYLFGDGTYDYGGKEIRHTYARSGTYAVTVEVQDAMGTRLSEKNCDISVSVDNSVATLVQDQPESEDRSFWQQIRDRFRRDERTQRSVESISCQQLTVETTTYRSAPATISFGITALQGGNNDVPTEYRIDYGDGNTDTNSTGRFSHTFTRNGNYTIQGYVRDENGSWTGGQFCQRNISLMDSGAISEDPSWSDYDGTTTKGGVDTMTTQPDTGPAAVIAFGSGMSALVGIGLRFFKFNS